MGTFKLPAQMAVLIEARNNLRDHYQTVLRKQGSDVNLKFTLDGNLVGDIGEAIAVELFGIRLVETKSVEGIDGYTSDGSRTVQIKATGTGRGPAFRNTETRADLLLFFDLDFEKACGTVVYNGPEHYAVQKLPRNFVGQRSLTAIQIRSADDLIPEEERIPMLEKLAGCQ